ncbi:MAG: hypothetical protein OSW77_14935, partial [Proteobacteria bacterium]|nr:hypothetical protein [Pseudomonadota bacterium]
MHGELRIAGENAAPAFADCRDAAILEARASGMQDTLQNLQQNSAKDRSREAVQSLARGGQEAAQSSRQLERAQAQQEQAQQKGDVAEGQLAQQAR